MSKKRIDLLLVEKGLFESRAKAQAAIAAGGVRVDGQVVAKPSDTVAEDSRIEAVPAHPWVGRGALKLAHALARWSISPQDRVVLDVGASTGGFTEVCLAAERGGSTRWMSGAANFTLPSPRTPAWSIWRGWTPGG